MRKVASNLTSREKRLGYRQAAVFWHGPKIQLRTGKANAETVILERRPLERGRLPQRLKPEPLWKCLALSVLRLFSVPFWVD
jgi:hypothetical protein